MKTQKDEELRGSGTAARIERAAELLCERDRLVKELVLGISDIDNRLAVVLGNDDHQFTPRRRESEREFVQATYRSITKKCGSKRRSSAGDE